MRRLLGKTAIAALAVGLAACEARNETADDAATTTGRADTMSDVTRQQEGMGERMEMPLQAVNNSGASGQVNLTPAEDQTTIIVTLERSERAGGEGQRHMAHIHSGTCANLGPVVAPLEPIVSDSVRGPTSTTLVDEDIGTLADGNHVVAAHEAGGEPGRPIVCAAIPARSGSDSAQAI